MSATHAALQRSLTRPPPPPPPPATAAPLIKDAAPAANQRSARVSAESNSRPRIPGATQPAGAPHLHSRQSPSLAALRASSEPARFRPSPLKRAAHPATRRALHSGGGGSVGAAAAAAPRFSADARTALHRGLPGDSPTAHNNRGASQTIKVARPVAPCPRRADPDYI
ncbi:dual specificity protein phosphatase 8-like [Schistocerca cancellata]|uniref:dual specificity protein phosphatase 8-like n=1 Tax=Schistocerca cancellata TaxID=274614 RepID=UPI0021188741|nr:dual specificity protein phosphatase 8-like [Schistocerca cancellata]